jgi:hypothetical protein
MRMHACTESRVLLKLIYNILPTYMNILLTSVESGVFAKKYLYLIKSIVYFSYFSHELWYKCMQHVYGINRIFT